MSDTTQVCSKQSDGLLGCVRGEEEGGGGGGGVTGMKGGNIARTRQLPLKRYGREA